MLNSPLLRLLSVTILTVTSTAHFLIKNPPARPFNEDTLAEYPCGGQTAVQKPRIDFPLSGAPVQLFTTHTSKEFEVVAALGNDPQGDDFTHVIVPTLQEFGPRNFCIPNVDVRRGLGKAAKDGVNVTLQVVASGDDGASSGLYYCMDVTLTSKSLSEITGWEPMCVNSEGVHYEPAPDAGSVNANGTAVGGGSSSGGGDPDAATSLRVPLTASTVAIVAYVGAFFLVG